MSTPIEPMIESAIAAFDRMNSQDPALIAMDGQELPRELALSLWLSQWIHRVRASPSVALRLASRCQHLMRFSMPRSDYPEGRVGYLTWRKDLSKRHADLATRVLQDVGFEVEVIEQVRKINLKQELKVDADCQAMEDALCLSFLDHEYADFCSKHSDEKVVDIVQKTWRKMSAAGQQFALQLPLEGRPKDLVLRALG